MPNPIKYSTGSESLALKKGNFYIGTGDVGKGPTSTTGYYDGITPPTGGYTIYLNKATGGPSIYTVSNDSELISLTNSIAGQSYTTVNECLVYFAGQTDKMVLNRDYEGIVTNGLILNLDAGFTPSYPKNGNTFYELITPNNITLYNSPTFNSDNGGIISFDGTNDYMTVQNPSINLSTTQISISIWYWGNTTQVASTVFRGRNASNGREFSTHIPWSNGIIYWDAGDNGAANTAFDRISKTSNGAHIGWNHWVFIKNATSGNMYIYRNGSLWHSGSGLSRNIGSITAFEMGGHSGSFIYDNGKISNIQIYNRELSTDEVLQNYNATKGKFGL